jgi:hypothetical protein
MATAIMKEVSMKTIVAAALGECVHVAGVSNFLRLAEQAGWRTVFLGPATSIEDVLAAARQEQADMVGVSYRLTPETGAHLLGRFAEAADDLLHAGVRFAFAGTPPLAEQARRLGFFEQVFDGSERADQVLAYLKGQALAQQGEGDIPQSTIARITWKRPFPLLRHHFGLPSMEATITGIATIAEAGCLDVISLGIDQDAQENFFRPERQDARRTGAGGVPVRNAEDYRRLYAASRRGNFPLLRTYSGTDDFLRLAEVYVETINIAWCAIPLFWFNAMDGRGPWDLEGSIGEHQKVMRWYGSRAIPVELNEPHHWGMRDAPDTVFVASAFLAAYNARAAGVHDYIAQLMFNSPSGHSDAMDLAKMLAILDLIEPLAGPDFRIWKETRTGLLSYPVDPVAARSHLATSVYLQMALQPDIVHIVGHTEAHHAATASDVIEACGLAQRAIEQALRGQPQMSSDPAIQRRKEELIDETKALLAAIRQIAPPEVTDPWSDPAILARAVAIGLLDAPQLRNNRFAPGKVQTRIINGACRVIDSHGQPLSEQQRIDTIFEQAILQKEQ